MNQVLKMSLKAFTEEYTTLLQGYSSQELRSILITMANEVSSTSRVEFINKLQLNKFKDRPFIAPSEDILDKIESIIEEINAQSEEEPDWDQYHDDENSIAEFEEFIPRLYGLFEKVEALFDDGHYDIARKAYQALFTIFDIEDDYGRGLSIYNLENLDQDEVRARYFRSVYLSEKAEDRAASLLDAMMQLVNSDYYARPKLQDIIEISANPLPEFTEFLHRWIKVTKTGSEPQHDAWFREATFLLHGSSGLEAIAKTEGKQRPRIYIDWVNALIESKNYKAALDAIDVALEQTPKNKPIRAAIGDLKIVCGQQLNNEEIHFDGQWISFEAKPDLSN